MRAELQPIAELAQKISADELAEFCGDLQTIALLAQQRLFQPKKVEPDESLHWEEAGKRLGVKKSWLDHHWRKFGLARKEQGRVIYSGRAIEKHIAKYLTIK